MKDIAVAVLMIVGASSSIAQASSIGSSQDLCAVTNAGEVCLENYIGNESGVSVVNMQLTKDADLSTVPVKEQFLNTHDPEIYFAGELTFTDGTETIVRKIFVTVFYVTGLDRKKARAGAITIVDNNVSIVNEDVTFVPVD